MKSVLAARVPVLISILLLQVITACSSEDDAGKVLPIEIVGDDGSASKRDASPVSSSVSDGGTATTSDAVGDATQDSTTQSVDPARNLVDELTAILGMNVTQKDNTSTGCRRYLLKLEQPINHNDSKSATFRQSAMLTQCNTQRPMVLHTTGYNLFDYPSEPFSLLDKGNELELEHRFFGESTPKPLDWTKLNIEQSAKDSHRWVLALNPIFRNKWVSTGTSKGGMTAVYHRKYFPNDVYASIPYVTPNSIGTSDMRYFDYIDQHVDKACDEHLIGYVKGMLKQRKEVVAVLSGDDLFKGFEHDVLDEYLESAALDIEWGFLQFYPVSDCVHVPTETSSAEAQARWLLEYLRPWATAAPEDDSSYTFQALTELGMPGRRRSPFGELLKYPEPDPARWMANVDPSLLLYEPTRVREVERWVRSQNAERIMFVYGEYDPWTGGAYVIDEAKESYRFFAPKSNHGANILSLAEADKNLALDTLSRWLGADAIVASTAARPRVRMPPLPPPMLRRLRRLSVGAYGNAAALPSQVAWLGH